MFGYVPIFVSSIDTPEDLIVSAWTSCPSVVECYIVIETEEYEKISLLKWLNYLKEKDESTDVSWQEGEEPEYILRSIKFNEIKKIIPTSKLFDKATDAAYMLSDHFYKQTPLAERYDFSFERQGKCNEKKILSFERKFMRTFLYGKYNEEAFQQLRKDIRNTFPIKKK